jgi:hypothetical protein
MSKILIMKNFYLSLVLLLFNLGVVAQIINIPDVNFKLKLIAANTSNDIAKNSFGNNIKIDLNSNNEIEVSEAFNVVQLNIATNILSTANDIVDLSGVENFINLKVLNCSGNSIASINVNALNLLEELKANNNVITNVVLSGASSSLKKIDFNHNDLTSLNTDNFINLTELFAYDNALTSISFNNNPLLESLNLRINSLTTLDVSVLPSLSWVSCDDNDLVSLNVSGLTQIDEIVCSNNLLTSLNLNGLTTLRILYFGGNQISSINLSTLSTLDFLECSNNPLSIINVNGLTNLRLLNANGTLISTLDCSQSGVSQLFASNCPNLQTINVRNDILSTSEPDLLSFSFRIENNPALLSICTDNGEQNNLAYTNYNTSGTVEVYNGLNCDIPVQVNLSVSDSTKLRFKIVPNPASSTVNILTFNNEVINKTTITNLLGQTVLTFQGNSVFEISSLAKGTYLLKVETHYGSETQKLIKQ